MATSSDRAEIPIDMIFSTVSWQARGPHKILDQPVKIIEHRVESSDTAQLAALKSPSLSVFHSS